METVKDFKDAGLVFVEGDKYENITSQCLNDWQWRVNHGSSGWNDDKIEEFAWRANTGEKPSFSGAVEVVYSGDFKEVFPVGRLNWVANDEDYEIIKWRPVISKEDKMEGKTNDPRANERVEIPECAPIYTKEMHEAGEPVIIGMEFKTESGEYCAHDVNDKSVCFVDEDGFFVGIPVGMVKPIDNRTDEEKLADLIVDIVEDYQHGEYIKRDIAESVSEGLIKAGYRKP